MLDIKLRNLKWLLTEYFVNFLKFKVTTSWDSKTDSFRLRMLKTIDDEMFIGNLYITKKNLISMRIPEIGLLIKNWFDDQFPKEVQDYGV